ncbi:MAG: hypothetical protein HOP33_09110 [Verrucomicrobia bacterium]|nr:hypothetical protein [Verrucomicrobiota bacterium]
MITHICNQCGQTYEGGYDGLACDQCNTGQLTKFKPAPAPEPKKEFIPPPAPVFDERPKIIDRAGSCESTARFLIFMAVLVGVIGAMAALGEVVNPFKLYMVGCITGGLLLWAFFLNILAQLLFIRAELTRKL